eukprot:COSAG03_NODE_21201_length_307_cov_1.043269_1_plen_37_part_10
MQIIHNYATNGAGTAGSASLASRLPVMANEISLSLSL